MACIQGQGLDDEWITESLGDASSSAAKQRSTRNRARAALALILTPIYALKNHLSICWKFDTTYTTVFAADVGTPVLRGDGGGGGDCCGGGGGGGAVEAVGAPCVGVTIGRGGVVQVAQANVTALPPMCGPVRIADPHTTAVISDDAAALVAADGHALGVNVVTLRRLSGRKGRR